MRGTRPTFVGTYAVFAGISLAAAVVIAGVSYLFVVRLSIEGGLGAVLVGCGISWVASCAGAIPVAAAVSTRSKEVTNAVLASTVLRFLVVLFLVAPLVLSGWFDRRVLVVCVAASYALMLLLDTVLATRSIKRLCESDS